MNEKIIQKEKIYFMNKVREKFVRTVEQVGVDASKYKKCHIKERFAGEVSRSSLPYSKGTE